MHKTRIVIASTGRGWLVTSEARRCQMPPLQGRAAVMGQNSRRPRIAVKAGISVSEASMGMSRAMDSTLPEDRKMGKLAVISMARPMTLVIAEASVVVAVAFSASAGALDGAGFWRSISRYRLRYSSE